MQRITRQKAGHQSTRPYTSTVPSIPPHNRKVNLNGLSEAEVKSHYRFLRDSIQFITDTLFADLKRPTERNHALKPQEQVRFALQVVVVGGGSIPKCTF